MFTLSSVEKRDGMGLKNCLFCFFVLKQNRLRGRLNDHGHGKEIAGRKWLMFIVRIDMNISRIKRIRICKYITNGILN